MIAGYLQLAVKSKIFLLQVAYQLLQELDFQLQSPVFLPKYLNLVLILSKCRLHYA